VCARLDAPSFDSWSGEQVRAEAESLLPRAAEGDLVVENARRPLCALSPPELIEAHVSGSDGGNWVEETQPITRQQIFVVLHVSGPDIMLIEGASGRILFRGGGPWLIGRNDPRT